MIADLQSLQERTVVWVGNGRPICCLHHGNYYQTWSCCAISK